LGAAGVPPGTDVGAVVVAAWELAMLDAWELVTGAEVLRLSDRVVAVCEWRAALLVAVLVLDATLVLAAAVPAASIDECDDEVAPPPQATRASASTANAVAPRRRSVTRLP
jgi:hypothetical protein